jgi:hypothetical protein
MASSHETKPSVATTVFLAQLPDVSAAGWPLRRESRSVT